MHESQVFNFNVAKNLLSTSSHVVFPFFQDGKPFDDVSPKWGMSLRLAKSMRFRWDEHNQNRTQFLQKLCQPQTGIQLKSVSLELIHSLDVFDLKTGDETQNKKGDGMITQNQTLLPIVTVADCMPIFLFDKKNKVFGALHSGWKGTGIIQEALKKAHSEYGTNPADVLVVLGPHIQSCCYIVDGERAEYFAKNFTPNCVTSVRLEDLSESALPDWNTSGKELFRLSLAKANLSVLEKCGVPEKNITLCTDCTCCTSPHVFGSFRRETATLPKDISIQERWKYFTVQAAYCGYL